MRRNILLKRILESDGQVVSLPTQASHICVCPKAALSEIETLRQSVTTDCIVAVEWLCDSLAANKILPIESYFLSAPREVEAKKRKLDVDTLSNNEAANEPNSPGVGARLADLFAKASQSLSILTKQPDEFRARVYMKASWVLAKIKDADFIPGKDAEWLRKPPYKLGDSVIEKVAEFLETGKIQKFEMLLGDPHTRAVNSLSEIFGVGHVTAEKLVSLGYMSLEDLATAPEGVLTTQQKLGLKYYEDFRNRIPKTEADEIITLCSAEITKVFGPDVIIEVGGSYRRGKKDFGDLDFIICADHPPEDNQHLMNDLLTSLKQKGFLSDVLSSGETTSLVVVRLSESHLHRRVDFKFWRQDVYAFALLHFTGDDQFNRYLRGTVKRKGYKLTDLGLFKGGERILCDTEEEIFKTLGFKYLSPAERIPENLVRLDR